MKNGGAPLDSRFCHEFRFEGDTAVMFQQCTGTTQADAIDHITEPLKMPLWNNRSRPRSQTNGMAPTINRGVPIPVIPDSMRRGSIAE